jgi:hypothetical protein
MKRLSTSVCHNTRSKKPRLTKCLSYESKKRKIVSATHTYNYMNKDPLVDWLKLKNKSHGSLNSNRNNNSKNLFKNFIRNKGINFEEKLINYIRKNIFNVVTISEKITVSSCEKTINCIKKGVPIIHSAPIKNPYNSTQGVIDLLVRSDYLEKIIEVSPLTEDEKKVKALKLNGNYHYVVIDIKFSTLPLRADGIHLLNSGNYPAYKSQLYIYNKALSYIQGYLCPYAFLLGRRWKLTRNSITESNNSSLNRLGRINYNTVDRKYIQETKNAINWVRKVNDNWNIWSVNPPSNIELYPNMCRDSGKWNLEKQKISENIGEITNIWNLGVKHRNEAIKHGIKTWKDERCNTQIMNFKGKKANTIDKILDINRQDKDKFLPKKIKNNIFDWKTETNNEFFIDFETFSDIFSDFEDLPNQKITDKIFMIGVGYCKNGKWKYKNFTSKNRSYEEEYRIMNEFVDFIKQNSYNPKLYYWCAESNFWKRSEQRQFDRVLDFDRRENILKNWKLNNWCDLNKIFTREPIVIKDCFNYGLKSIAKSMKKHNMIESSLESNCKSGMSAMITAWNYYNEYYNKDETIIEDIKNYNEYDCKVLWEILSYIRTNHK